MTMGVGRGNRFYNKMIENSIFSPSDGQLKSHSRFLDFFFSRERAWKFDRNRCGPLIRTPESMHLFVMPGTQVNNNILNCSLGFFPFWKISWNPTKNLDIKRKESRFCIYLKRRKIIIFFRKLLLGPVFQSCK